MQEAQGSSRSCRGVATRRGPDWLMPASRLSCSASAAGPSRAMPSTFAGARYLRTVLRDRPVPDAISRGPTPACQRRMISGISILGTSRYAIAAPQFQSAAMIADVAPNVA